MEIEGLEGLNGADILQDTFLFRFLNFDETMALSRLIDKEQLEAGDVIIQEGALGKALYVVEDGVVKVEKGDGADREKLAELGRGEMFGEMSLIEDELTSATVIAKTDVELLVINRGDLEGLMDDNIALAFKIYKTFCHVLSERLRRTSSELLEIKHGKAGSKKAEAEESSKKPAKKAAKKGAKKKAGKKAKK